VGRKGGIRLTGGGNTLFVGETVGAVQWKIEWGQRDHQRKRLSQNLSENPKNWVEWGVFFGFENGDHSVLRTYFLWPGGEGMMGETTAKSKWACVLRGGPEDDF